MNGWRLFMRWRADQPSTEKVVACSIWYEDRDELERAEQGKLTDRGSDVQPLGWHDEKGAIAEFWIQEDEWIPGQLGQLRGGGVGQLGADGRVHPIGPGSTP